VLTVRQLFELVADCSIGSDEEKVKARIASLQKQNKTAPPRTGEDLVDEAVFLHSFIPRTLHAVTDPIADLDKLRAENTAAILHAPVSGLNESLAAVEEEKRRNEESEDSDSDTSEGSSDESLDEGSPAPVPQPKRSTMSREERKRHKKEVKSKRKESRVHKHK